MANVQIPQQEIFEKLIAINGTKGPLNRSKLIVEVMLYISNQQKEIDRLQNIKPF